MILEPIPPDPHRLRYSTWPFPSSRFLPGLHPHPRRDPKGHSYGIAEPNRAILPPADWESFSWYLFGVDLYNYSYWWECHEVFEALWHGAGHDSEQGLFFRGIIQVAASNLKYHLNKKEAAKKLVGSAVKFLSPMPTHFMGLDIPTFLQDIQGGVDGVSPFPVPMTLLVTNRLPDDQS